MTNNISYTHSAVAKPKYADFLKKIIKEHNFKNICEVGGGANPHLKNEYIKENRILYSILDISETELAKAPTSGEKILADIASPTFKIKKKFDFVFSKMLAEHIYNAEQFHKNVFNMLTEKGMAVHFFPTLYTLPFLVNYLLPESVTDSLLHFFDPQRDRYQHEKFPAYYDWCRGPIPKQITRIKALGYEIVEYRGFFGHDYYENIKFLQKLHELKTNYLLNNPAPLFTSYAYIVLKKAESMQDNSVLDTDIQVSPL